MNKRKSGNGQQYDKYRHIVNAILEKSFGLISQEDKNILVKLKFKIISSTPKTNFEINDKNSLLFVISHAIKEGY